MRLEDAILFNEISKISEDHGAVAMLVHRSNKPYYLEQEFGVVLVTRYRVYYITLKTGRKKYCKTEILDAAEINSINEDAHWGIRKSSTKKGTVYSLEKIICGKAVKVKSSGDLRYIIKLFINRQVNSFLENT
jgi:hypothetical protein